MNYIRGCFVSTAIHSSGSAREAVSHKETVLNGGLWGYFILCFCFYFKEHPPTSSRNLIKQHLENVKPSLMLF